MKKLFTILTAVLITATVCLPTQVKAQSPEKMTYQSVIRNASDQLVTNQDMGMQISILQGSASGMAVYIETHSTASNANGLVTIEIGNGIVVSGDFTNIDWANGPYFIKTETDPTTAGGTNYTITGTSQLLSVPYALYAKTVENDAVDDADADPSNEFQDLNLNGTTLEITDGTSADLSSLQDGTGTDDQTLSEVLIQSNDAGATNITNLADPVNDQDATTKAYVDLLENRIWALENPDKITDYDGNIYETVTIGTQVWMAEDLKVTHYPNGDAIPYIDNNANWSALTDDNISDAYSVYGDSNDDGIVDVANPDYGYLYSYAAAIGDNWTRDNADGQGVCPDGWHLPSDAEWTELSDYLDGVSVAGGKLKETGTIHWNSPNTGADNSSGFSALPGGYRYNDDGTFIYMGNYGLWWTSTESSSTEVYYRGLNYNNAEVGSTYCNKSHGLSVRCIKD